MIRANIADVKMNLSKFLDQVAEGEVVLVCRRNVPIAEIRGLAKPVTERRIGTARGLITIPDSFFEPLPDELLAAFEGKEP